VRRASLSYTGVRNNSHTQRVPSGNSGEFGIPGPQYLIRPRGGLGPSTRYARSGDHPRLLRKVEAPEAAAIRAAVECRAQWALGLRVLPV